MPSLGLEPDSDLDLDPDLDSDLDPDLDLDPGDAEADLAGQPPFDAPRGAEDPGLRELAAAAQHRDVRRSPVRRF